MKPAVRYALAAFSLGVLVYVIGTMPFGSRGYHFVPEAAAEQSVAEPSGYDLSKLELLTRCVGYVRSYYVEPERFEPREMLVSAIESVQDSVPPLLAKVHRSEDDAPTAIDVTVYGETRSFSLGAVADLYQMNWKLLDVFEFIERRLRKQERVSDIEYAAVAGMLSTLDPHSVILTPDVYREMKLGTSGEFGGLGIVISVRSGKLTVVSVIDDTPAAEARLESGDAIVQIGEESTINMSLNEAVNRLRGAPGTAVTIWVERSGWPEPKAFTIARANITIRSAEGQALGRGVGYVRIKHFQQNTFRELRTELNRLRTSGHWRGLILDLRDNPGGLLEQAIKVSDAFLSEGTIVTTVGAGSNLREEKHASAADTFDRIPMVVLVNAGSASASEIVAGALKNNGRAIVIGDRTFGKGSVQVLYDIDDGALKLTIAQYLTPGDQSIQSVGIMPDIQTTPVELDRDRVDLFATDRDSHVEADLPKHLVHTSARGDDRAEIVIRYLEDEESPEEDSFHKDKAITFAERLLTVVDGPERETMLAAARALFQELSQEEDERIQDELRALGVDWRPRPRSAPGRAAAPRLSLEFRVEADEDPIPAGADFRLVARVTNEGSDTLHRVHGITRSSYGRLDDLEFVFGRLRPGESREWSLPLKMARAALSRWATARLDLFAAGEALDVSAETALAVAAAPRPGVALLARVSDVEQGNGDGRIQRGERFQLRLDLRNEGPGRVSDGLVTVSRRGGDAVFIHTGRRVFSELASEERTSAVFDLEVKPEFPDDELTLTARVLDRRLRHQVEMELVFPVGPPSSGGAAPEARLLRALAAVPVFAAPAEEAQPVFVLPAGSVVMTEARVGGYVRASFGAAGRGWLREGNLEDAPGGARPIAVAPALRCPLAAPTVGLGAAGPPPLRVDDATLRFEASVHFPVAPTEARRLVYVYRGEEKVFFEEFLSGDGEPIRAPLRVPLALEPGQNRISVFARIGEQPPTRRTFFVYRSGAEIEPVGEVR